MVKKGAKAIEEDFSDVPTLPELNSLIFTMLLEFKDKERKQQVYDRIKQEWAEKVKVITKDDIIDYGKRKLTIAEDEDVNDVQKVAKAASEKLFEQFVTARREKKEKIAKLTEEAKANATEEDPDPQPDIDPNEIDCYFHLPDYPSNSEEAAALNNFKYSLNSLLHLEEKPTIIEKKTDPEVDEEGNPIEGTEQVVFEEEEIPEANRIPDEEIKQQLEITNSIRDALKQSGKDSAIRTFVLIKKEYNHKIIEPVPAEEGTPEDQLTEENKGFNSIDEVAKEIVQTLDKTAHNLIKYQKFKQNADLIHLKVVPPEPEVESKVDQEGEGEGEGEQEPQEEEKVEDKSKAKGKADKSKADKSKAVEEEEPPAEEPEPELEVTLPREWNSESYQSVVKDLPEDKKSIAGLLSACIINVCEELDKQNNILEENQDVEEEDEYKYIFDDDMNEIASSQGFAERNVMSGTESMFSKEAGRSMFSSAYKSRESWNQDVVLDAQDVASINNDCVLMNGDNIATIETGIYSYLRIPGSDRTNMPTYPEKSRLKRDAERPEVYPFCTIPIEEFERALLLKTIEDQFKSKEPDYDWNFFERCIEEKYSKKSLVQEISDALLWEPDVISKYYVRDDSFLLGIYQKLPADKSYTKQWKSQYRSMPDFSNWLEFFNTEGDKPIPLYDIDDNKVGQIREFIQNLTPTNGGLMRIKKQNIGLEEYIQTECFKDGLIFGIHAQEEGSLSDNFWLSYDRNTRLDFRQIQGVEGFFTPLPDVSVEQQEGEGDDAPPEDEEAAKLRKEQEEQEKAKREEERLAQMNEEYAAYKMKGSGATLSYNSGILVDLLPNGYVMLSKSKDQRKLMEDGVIEQDFEESRIITGKSMIRYMAQGKIEIMHSNGNFSVYDPSTDLWTITNNAGERRCKRQSDGHQYEIEPIPVAYETCGETNARVLFKEDNVISIEYPNGDRYTIHHDGTKIISNADQSEIVYEKVGFPLAKVLSGDNLLEEENPINVEISQAEREFYDTVQTSREYMADRIRDQTVIQTYMADRSVIQSFVEVQEFGITQPQPEEPIFDMDGEGEIDTIKDPQQTTGQNQTQENKEQEGEGEGDQELVAEAPIEDGPHYLAVHLIFRQDLSVTKITSEGEACLISGPTRLDLNKNGEIKKVGKDTDYLLELFELRSQDRKGGIFTCDLGSSQIMTHDKDKNYFSINSNGTFEKILAPELSEVDQVEEEPEEEMEGEGAQEPEIENISKGEKTNRTKSNVPNVNLSKASKTKEANEVPVNPRIFLIKVDGTGSEFLTKQRMDDETARIGHDVETVKTTQFLGQNPVTMHSYFTEYKTGEEVDQEFSVVANLQAEEMSDFHISGIKCIPKNVLEYPQVFREMVDKPKSKVFLFKNYVQHKDFDYFKRNAFQEDLERYKKWKEDSEAANAKKLGLFFNNEEAGDNLTTKERELDKRIITKIYRERQTKKQDYGYKEVKDMGIQSVTNQLRNFKGQEDQLIKVKEESAKQSEQQEQVSEPIREPHTAKGDKPDDITLDQAPEPSKSIDPSFEAPETKRKRTVIIREEISELKKEPHFLPNYFDTHFGKLYIQANPPKPPNEEVMLRMSQRMSRSIGHTEGAHSQENEKISQYTGQNFEESRKTGEIRQPEEEMDDNAIVALEPEEDDEVEQMRMTGGSQLKHSQLQDTIEEPQYVPSNYLQEKEMIRQKEETNLLKAEEYHVSKTKEFNVYGKLRPLKLKVKSIAKSRIKPEMNEKFITTECITDNRIKISSMANRAYQNAPSVAKVRKQGQHQMILQAIQKKQTFNELIGTSNAMVTSAINDPMKRSVNILPSEANFGSIKEGEKYEIVVACKNEDCLPQRVVIRPGRDPRITIQQDRGGAIAMGMVKNIIVTIDTTKPADSRIISDSFEIRTKTDIFRVPIKATVHTEEQFEEINAESMKIHNKSAMKSTVRQVLDKKRQTVNDMLHQVENKGWIETTGSESKLPSLPNINNRAFEPDAQRKLDEVIEGKSSRAPSRRESQGSRMSRRTLGSKRSNRQ